MSAPLTIDALRAGYGRLEILQGVSLRVEPGQIVGIIGPNGAGKSTLLRAVLGYVKPWSGSIKYGAVDLTGLPAHRMVRSGIGYVAQGRGLFADMSVRENLLLGGYTVRGRAALDRAIAAALQRFPYLRGRQGQLAGSLSGGEQRGLAIARALMTEPRMLLLDEPSAALSPQAIETVYQTLRTLQDQGLGMLIVEQNVQVIMDIAQRIYVLDVGRNAFDGTADELRGLERIRRLYLGDEGT